MQHLPSLGETLRSRRIELGLSQERLAELISTEDELVTQADISRLETGRIKLPRCERLLRLASALGLMPGELLARSGWAGANVTPNNGTAAILDAVADAIVVVDPDWTCMFINRSGAELLGTEPDVALGRSIWDLFTSAVEMPFYRQARRAMLEHDSVHFQDYYPALGKWLSSSLYPTADGLTVLLWDVTEDVQSATLAQDNAEDGLERLVTVDDDGRIVQAWDAVDTLFGYATSEAVGKPLTILVPERFRKSYQQYYDECILRHDGAFADIMLGIIGRRKDGHEFPLEIRMHRLDTPHAMQIVCALPETGDGRAADELLRVSEERLRAVIEHSGTALAITGRDLRYTWVANPLPGFTADEIIGQRDEDLLPPDIASVVTRTKQRVLTTGHDSRDRYTMTESDGEHVYDVTTTALRDRFGSVIGVLTAATDVTRLVQLETRLAAMLAGERVSTGEPDSTRAALLADINRMVVRPAAAIAGYVQMAQHDAAKVADPEVERVRAHLDQIAAAATDLTHAISDLLLAAPRPAGSQSDSAATST